METFSKTPQFEEFFSPMSAIKSVKEPNSSIKIRNGSNFLDASFHPH